MFQVLLDKILVSVAALRPCKTITTLLVWIHVQSSLTLIIIQSEKIMIGACCSGFQLDALYRGKFGRKHITLANDNFLMISPFLSDFQKCQTKYSLCKRKYQKTSNNLVPKWHILSGFVTNRPFAKDFGRKMYPWLRIFSKNTTLAKEYMLCERHNPIRYNDVIMGALAS